MKSKLIVIMIDGVSSDYFIDYPLYMPHTHALARHNTVITNLDAERCGSSLPGRASMLTGLPSREHGIYGNRIWDAVQQLFRYASPYDVRTPTLFSRATAAGLDTASIGFGMTRPEDCRLYHPPHWVHDFVSRSRDERPITVSSDWKRALTVVDDGRLAQALSSVEANSAQAEPVDESALLNELIADQRMIQRVNALIASAQPPDLIFTEINVTDSVQHHYGYASATAHFSIAFADMLVGSVVQQLKTSALDNEYSIIITSDHGHANTEKAIFVDNLIAQANWSSECAVLFLPQDNTLDQALDALHQCGADILDERFLPTDTRGQIIAAAIREKGSFEPAQPGCSDVTGRSKYRSSHSYFPGTQSDKRFAVISGPACKNARIDTANTAQFYDMMEDLLGLSH